LTEAKDVVNFLVETLREYDYKNVNKTQMYRLIKNRDVIGLTNFNTKNIYVRKDLPFGEYAHTLFHEVSHVYHYYKGDFDAPEEVVDALAYKWHQIVYGLEEKLK